MSVEIEEAKIGRSKFELNPPSLFTCLLNRNSEFTDHIIKIARKAEYILSMIPATFEEYTLHDINHSIRIIDYMYKLIPNIDELSDLEITILIYSALLHDIGMFCSEDDRIQIEKGEYTYSNLDLSSIIKSYEGNKKEALKYFVRVNHAKRSALYIKAHLNEFMSIPSQETTNFSHDVASICESHNENFEWINIHLTTYEEKGIYSYNPQFCAILLRLADILDFDGQRTPPILYNLINPKGFSKNEWKQHFVIDNKDKIKVIENSKTKKVMLIGECSDVNIHRKILEYVSWINNEIKNTNIVTENWENKYLLQLKFPVENKIKTKGFTASNLKLSVDYKSISRLLMGENIYREKFYGLREIIQNSIDACYVKKEIINKNKKFGDDEYIPTIKVIVDKSNNIISIEDNGIGMNQRVLQDFFLSIGNSYYRSDSYIYSGINYNSIGRFGIGFLATFMLSQEVRVQTRYLNSNKKLTLLLSKDSEFVCMEEIEDLSLSGTIIDLNYNEFMNVFDNNIEKLKGFLNTHFITDEIDIKLIDRGNLTNTVIDNKVENEFISKDNSWIDVSKYLKDVNGFVKINDNIYLQNNFSDLYTSKTYYFDGNKLNLINIDSFDMNKVYNNLENHIFSIDIYYLTKDTFQIYNMDVDKEYFNPLQHNLDKITILMDKEIEEDLNFSAQIMTGCSEIQMDNLVLEKYKPDEVLYSNIPNLKHSQINDVIELGRYPVFLKKVKNNILLDSNSKEFLPIDKHSFDRNDDKYDDLYLRGVLVDKWRLGKKSISYLILEGMHINVKNRLIEPDISRSNLSKESTEILRDSLYAVPYLWLLENKRDANINLIKEFIELNYPKYKRLIL
ncbi:hypothetical protein EYB33_23035 [Lysinibacillus sphaericus]|uniref:HD domain-containing protein n=1 Tax=Lysinibacillus sphaericus TaxID=1421 RepID=UPI001E47B85B|nr:ATP-binding protein [Lysinibacillus sphaericus]UDK98955.1 hypothetical protein EYB33_23035 [Lysinibacillus sphaericus]